MSAPLWAGAVLLSGLSDTHSDLPVRTIVSVRPGRIVEDVLGLPTTRVSLAGCTIVHKDNDDVIVQGAPWLSRPIRVRSCGEPDERRRLYPALVAAASVAPAIETVAVVDGNVRLLRMSSNKHRIVLECSEVVITGLQEPAAEAPAEPAPDQAAAAPAEDTSSAAPTTPTATRPPLIKYKLLNPPVPRTSLEATPPTMQHFKIKDSAKLAPTPPTASGSASAAATAPEPMASVKLIGVRKMNRTPLWKYQGLGSSLSICAFDPSKDLAAAMAAVPSSKAAAAAAAAVAADDSCTRTVPSATTEELAAALTDAIAFLKGTWRPKVMPVVEPLSPLPSPVAVAATAEPQAEAAAETAAAITAEAPAETAAEAVAEIEAAEASATTASAEEAAPAAVSEETVALASSEPAEEAELPPPPVLVIEPPSEPPAEETTDSSVPNV
jgi:hypothetical protein